MNIRLITKGFFLITRVVIISLCLALPWTGALSPRACFGLDSAEFNVTENSGVAGAAAESSGLLTISTYSTYNEGHIITFPDSTTMGIDCGTGNITTLSHYHNDHCDGNQQYNRDNVSLGQVIYNKDGVTVTVVATNCRVIGDANGGCTSGDENACSMVLWVKYKGFDYLSGGDLTASPEGRLGSALAARGVKIDVLKVHHHGSSGSSSSSFLQNISPEYAVVSGHASTLKPDTLQRLKSAGVKIIYDTFNDQSDPQFKYSGGDITISTNGCTYSFSAPNFNDGPYKVDEPCYEEQPPHLMVTEVAVGDHTAPENHDWIELYLPPDAAQIDLSTYFWTGLDVVQRAATSTVTLMPGDVVILHDAPGLSESNVTGKYLNGNSWWDIFVENPADCSWNKWDDAVAITSVNSKTPTQTQIIDAVVWSNDDGQITSEHVLYNNYFINYFHWGDPTAGYGQFSTTNEGPAIGDIDLGYAQRITTIDTNSKGDWLISPTNSEGTPPEPTPMPTPTPPPPPIEVILNSSSLAAGETLNVRVVVQPFTGRPFDAYAVITGKAGLFSIQLGNHLRRGIIPIVQDIPALPKGYSGVLLNMTVPRGVAGDYRVVAGLVDAGGKVRGPGSAFAYDVEHLSVR